VSGGTVTVLGLVVLAVAAAALELAAHRRNDRPSAAQAIGAAMRTTPGRAAVLAVWLWLGIHFLAR
jgi:predicted lipoprotein